MVLNQTDCLYRGQWLTKKDEVKPWGVGVIVLPNGDVVDAQVTNDLIVDQVRIVRGSTGAAVTCYLQRQSFEPVLDMELDILFVDGSRFIGQYRMIEYAW